MNNYIITIVNPFLNQKVQYLYTPLDKKITAQTIEKDGEKIILNNNTETFQPREHTIFNFILEAKYNISYEDFEKLFPSFTPEKLTISMSRISNKFKTINHVELKTFNTELSTELLFTTTIHDIHRGTLGLTDNFQVQCIGEFEEDLTLKKIYEEKQKAEESVSTTELMSLLLEKSELLPKILFQTTQGDFLPFIQIHHTENSDNPFPFKFPLLVNNESTSIKHDWNRDSFKAQRQGLAANMYNGRNFRALTIQNNQFTIAHSLYFDILDSADHVASRLKMYHHQQNTSQFKKIFDIWSERLTHLHEQNLFDSYNSGIAFSIPVFQVCSDGSLKVLAAKSNRFKATGSGKRHVAPAGMMEIFSKFKQPEFSFEDFKIVCLKELLEETVFGQDNLKLQKDENNQFLDSLIPFFEQQALRHQDKFTLGRLQDAINVINENWDEIWKFLRNNNQEKIPNKGAFTAMLNLSEETFYRDSYFVVDFANLRPEFIMPIYINEPLNEIVNWEYDQEDENIVIKNDILTFKNLDELNTWAKNQVNDYCAPALAAIYLGAKQFFTKKH